MELCCFGRLSEHCGKDIVWKASRMFHRKSNVISLVRGFGDLGDSRLTLVQNGLCGRMRSTSG